MLSIIVAEAQNHAIGRKNQLLWHISEDLKYFKKITSGHSVIMGHNTFESIGKPLPNRRNIVISEGAEARENVTVVHSLEEAIRLTAREEESFIIGGGSIYKAALPYASRIYLTLIHADYEADTFFPVLDMREWRVISREDFPRGKDFPHPFSFLVYERI